MSTRPGRFASIRRFARASIFAVVGLPLAACLAQPPVAQAPPPQATDPSPTRVPGPDQVVEIAIRDYTFQPAELKIHVGTTVRWTNQEKRVSHSVLFTGSGGFESDRIFPGESWERRFDEPGVYPFTCGPHPEMHGSIQVTGQ